MQEIPSGYIIGADEVGLGSWAGPLCVGAVRAPFDWHLPGLRDSKQLTRTAREQFHDKLWQLHSTGEIFISIQTATNQDIDREGVATVQKKLFVQALNCCAQVGTATAVVDGKLRFKTAALQVPYRSLVKADTHISTVMAASVVAKVHRDHYMYQQASLYPEYDFLNNVGYGTASHRAALALYGPIPLHRMSYRPLKLYQDRIS